MPAAQTETLAFLASRRSVPPRLLTAPVPDREALLAILTLAARVPDHGILVPFRFVVLAAPALRRIGDGIARIGAEAGVEDEKIAKARAVYATSPLAVAVIGSPQESGKAPEIEQLHSAGSACLQLLNAASAAGWAAGWVTGWAAHDRRFLPALLGLSGSESVVGLVHIGTGPAQADRPRPDIPAIIQWVEA